MSAGRVLVYGGRGALGSTVVSTFKNASYWVLNIDMKDNEEADHNIIVTGDSWTSQVWLKLVGLVVVIRLLFAALKDNHNPEVERGVKAVMGEGNNE